MFKRCLVAGLAGLMLTSCASVRTPFTRMAPDYSAVPEESLRNAAAAIERAIEEGDRDFQPDNRSDLVLDTERIQQAIRTRAARDELIDEFLDTGFAYERRNGLVHIIRNREYKQATTSTERDRNALLVMGENESRWNLYEGIVDANNLPPSGLAAVQEIFYEARIPLMDDGQMYEGDGGEAVPKQ